MSTSYSLNIQRVKAGHGFAYRLHGRRLRGQKILTRLDQLVLPPAWREVRIAEDPRAPLQATGIDGKGRKQYRYHENFRKRRDDAKFAHIADFARHLPKIRRAVKRHLRRSEFSRERVLAAIVAILERTNIRIGNEVYSRTNGSYGLTTLRNRHAHVRGNHVQFYFRAKSGKMREIEFDDACLSEIVRKCQHTPRRELFCYYAADRKVHAINSHDVNRFIREISGGHFSAKDFRTWCGTVHAIERLRQCERAKNLSEREWRKRHLAIIRATAEYLGNTPAICEKYYIHPDVFAADRAARDFGQKVSKRPGFSEVECLALKLLKT